MVFIGFLSGRATRPSFKSFSGAHGFFTCQAILTITPIRYNNTIQYIKANTMAHYVKTQYTLHPREYGTMREHNKRAKWQHETRQENARRCNAIRHDTRQCDTKAILGHWMPSHHNTVDIPNLGTRAKPHQTTPHHTTPYHSIPYRIIPYTGQYNTTP
jgi:hypothetical protein